LLSRWPASDKQQGAMLVMFQQPAAIATITSSLASIYTTDFLMEKKEKSMRSVSPLITLAAAVLIGLIAPATAANEDATEARLRKLEASLQALQAELAALKAERAAANSPQPAPADYQAQIDTMVEKAVAEKTSNISTTPSWVQNVQLFGDFRYRHEQTNDTGSTTAEQRDQHSIRARLGLKATINDEFDAIFRIASGSSDTPVSANQTLDDSFSSKDIWLDRAYFDYHPASVPGLNVYGGKMKQPFYTVGENELVWDGDLSPEGIVGTYTFNLDSANVATISGGGLWLDERAGDADSSMWGLQGLLRHNFNDEQYALAGLSWYDLGNVENRTVSGVSLNGNTNNGAGGYEYDYNMIEAFGEYGFALAGMPSAAYGAYIENTAADSGRNSGFVLGMRLNKMTKKVGSWQTFYNYSEVDPDAVFAGLSDSNFLLGGTGGKGHELGFQYMLRKNVSSNISYFLSERADRPGQEGGNIHVLHADLIFKF